MQTMEFLGRKNSRSNEDTNRVESGLTLVGKEGIGDEEANESSFVASKPGTSGVYAVTMTGRLGSDSSRPGTHTCARSVSKIDGLDWEGRPNTNRTSRSSPLIPLSRQGIEHSHMPDGRSTTYAACGRGMGCKQKPEYVLGQQRS